MPYHLATPQLLKVVLLKVFLIFWYLLFGIILFFVFFAKKTKKVYFGLRFNDIGFYNNLIFVNGHPCILFSNVQTLKNCLEIFCCFCGRKDTKFLI